MATPKSSLSRFIDLLRPELMTQVELLRANGRLTRVEADDLRFRLKGAITTALGQLSEEQLKEWRRNHT